MAEGVGWKFAPLRLFPGHFELSLDNDCILWELPEAIRQWLAACDEHRCVLAEDVRPALGQFESLCGGRAMNSGIRGLAPGFHYDAALRRVLALKDREAGAPVVLRSELDEQGLQAAAVSSEREPLLVATREVSICSPFHPHRPDLGTCGAHFVGLNARHLPWRYFDRPADEWRAEHWAAKRADVRERVGLGAAARPPATGLHFRRAGPHTSEPSRPAHQHRIHHASPDHRPG
jgi:hypothetical protein